MKKEHGNSRSVAILGKGKRCAASQLDDCGVVFLHGLRYSFHESGSAKMGLSGTNTALYLFAYTTVSVFVLIV
jgi:hypothetical protein